MIFLSGQVKRDDLVGGQGIRQFGIQETDILSIVKPITKYAVQVQQPGDIRYEMEKDYFEGKISIDDFREIWNGKYQSYLGITPASDAQGVLQDISWSSGYLGYFQSYTLGNLYGAQILSALLKDVPKAFEEIKVGNFAPINSWMQEHIFRYGALYNASETIERISGKPLGTEDFLIYLRQKYCGE